MAKSLIDSMMGNPSAAEARTIRLFVSYSHKDLTVAQRVHASLKSSGVEVFLAEHDVKAGQELTAKILPAIDRCDVFVLLWSRSSQESNWVRDEVSRARIQGKYIVPVLLEKDVAMPPTLGDMKYIAVGENFDSAITSVKAIIAERVHRKVAAVAARAKSQLAVAACLLLLGAALTGE